jgi:hypothetical protein
VIGQQVAQDPSPVQSMVILESRHQVVDRRLVEQWSQRAVEGRRV